MLSNIRTIMIQLLNEKKILNKEVIIPYLIEAIEEFEEGNRKDLQELFDCFILCFADKVLKKIALERNAEPFIDLYLNKNNIKEEAFIKSAIDLVLTNLEDERFGTKELCQGLNLSRMQVHRNLKRSINMSASQFIQFVRVEKSKELLTRVNGMQVKEVAYKTGFKSPCYFSQVFSKMVGMSPREYSQRGLT